MKTQIHYMGIVAGVILLICCMVTIAAPMGTAFTYQGRLLDDNTAADGLYDMQFKLYDDPNVVIGGQVGSTVTANDVDVTDGYFIADLDFGSDPNVFNSDTRWLEIAVRPYDSTDPNDYVALAPLQPIMPAPYAVYAESSGSSAPDSDWTVTAGDDMYSAVSGNVGIGTTSPGEELHISKNADEFVGIQITNTNTGASSSEGIQILNEGSWAGMILYDDDASGYSNRMRIFNNRPSGSISFETEGIVDACVNNGNFGIGTSNPGSKLEIYDGSVPSLRLNGHPLSSARQILINNDGLIFHRESGGVNDLIIDDGGNVGIGTVPLEKLDVNGHINSNETYKLDGNTVLHNNGDMNIFVGRDAGAGSIITGVQNSGLGYQALNSNASGSANTAIGGGALKNNTSGVANAAVGQYSLLYNNTGNYNVAVGPYAGQFNQGGSSNTFIGFEAGSGMGTDDKSGNVFLGFQAGYFETGDNKLYIENSNSSSPLIYGEFDSDLVAINGQLKITGGSPGSGKVLTSDADGLASWQTPTVGGNVEWDNDGNNIYSALPGNVSIGTILPTEKLDVAGSINSAETYKLDGVAVLSNQGTSNIFVGQDAGSSNTTGSNNSAVGAYALNSNTTGNHNSAMGTGALADTTGSGNSAMGAFALSSNTTGYDNSAMGNMALVSNTTGSSNSAMGEAALSSNTTGHYNSAMGDGALHNNTTGNHNVAIGCKANYNNQGGSANTMIGDQAGCGTTLHDKSGNVFIGHLSGYFETGDNKLYIENSDSSSPLIYGEFDNDLVAINGQLQITGGSPGAGKVLTCDPNGLGLASWEAIAVGVDSDWTISGSDMYSAVSGNVGIGVTSPDASVHIKGENWNLDTTEGDFKIGDSNYRLKIGVATGGGGAGDVFIRSVGGSEKLKLGSGPDDILIVSPDGVGIGTTSQDELTISDKGDDESKIVFKEGGAPAASIHYDGIGTGGDNRVHIRNEISGSEADLMTWKLDGTVGVGTSDPEYDLDVSGIVRGIRDPNCYGMLGTLGAAVHGFNIYNTECAGVLGQAKYGAGISGESTNGIAGFFTSAKGRGLIVHEGDVGIGTLFPAGKLDVNGEIYQRGGLLHADYVFEPDYDLESIEEHAEFMYANKHLKAIPKAKVDENGVEVVEVGSHRKGIVEELEKAHIYIHQLNEENNQLRERLENLEQQMDRLLTKQQSASMEGGVL